MINLTISNYQLLYARFGNPFPTMKYFWDIVYCIWDFIIRLVLAIYFCLKKCLIKPWVYIPEPVPIDPPKEDKFVKVFFKKLDYLRCLPSRGS